MPTVDRRPAATENDPADAEVLNEEVKAEETMEVEPEATEAEPQEETSTSEESEPEETAVVEDTTEKTVAVEQAVDPIAALKLEEKRIRDQIVELRKERRSLKDEKPKEELIVPDLKDVASADIALIERVLKAKGYVQKSDVQSMTYQEKLDAEKNSWLNAHPEYLPANDTDDTKWTALNNALTTYFKAPANPGDIGKILDLAHGLVGGTRQVQLPVKNIAKTNAAKEKLTVTSKGANAGKGATTKETMNKKKIDTSYLIGFTPEEIEEIANS